MNQPNPSAPQDSHPGPGNDPNTTSANQNSQHSEAGSNEPLEATIQQLEKKCADLTDRLLRSQAELENFRRRTQRDAEEQRRFESLRLLRDLLPGLDGLQRAIQSAEQTGDSAALLNGIRMVATQFRDILKTHSAEPIDAVGKPFDPNQHEALTQVPSADCEPMTVLQVVETGYRLHDRVVRPARVIVSCAPSQN